MRGRLNRDYGRDMRLTHLGHACVLVEDNGTRLLIDPGEFSDFDDVFDLDAVLITHQHADHCDPERIGDLRDRNPQAIVRADPQSAALLNGFGLSCEANTTGVAFQVGGIRVTPTGEQHAMPHPYATPVGNLGLYLDGQGTTMFHPGDALDAETPGPVDLLFVPLNAPWCSVRESIAFVRRLQPEAVIPIHDALLSPAGRRGYLRHLSTYGADDGIPVRDLSEDGPFET
jgi:L-ascorbate metabolism protein UlaG (beta-lactamase superfamily)